MEGALLAHAWFERRSSVYSDREVVRALLQERRAGLFKAAEVEGAKMIEMAKANFQIVRRSGGLVERPTGQPQSGVHRFTEAGTGNRLVCAMGRNWPKIAAVPW